MSDAANDAKLYYVLIDGEAEGPFSLIELRNMLKGSRITWETLYAVSGMADWSPLIDMLDQLEDVAKTKTVRQEPPPKSASKATRMPEHERFKRPPIPSLQQLMIDQIRDASCYRALRQLIDFVAAVGYLVAALTGLCGIMSIFSVESLLKVSLTVALFLLVIAAITAVLITALRQALLLLVDIADTLIYESGKKF